MRAGEVIRQKAYRRRLDRCVFSSMFSSSMHTHPISLLVPSAALPAEGAEFDWPAGLKAGTGFNDWLRVFRTLCGDASPRFHMRKAEVDLPADIEGASTLQWVRLGFIEGDAQPQIEALPASTSIDWSAVLGRVTAAMGAEHFIATHQEMIRVFLEETRAAVNAASRGLSGNAVPIVSVRADGENVMIAFHGVWQADVGALGSLKGGPAVKSLRESAPATLDGCLVLDESEVEGRGLLEAVLSVSMLAMVFQDQQKAAPPPSMASTAPITQVVEQADESHVSEPLEVKSQKLKQPGPLVYPNVIKSANGAGHKVVVDISAQRAFVFIGDKLAFETPVSSAAKGRHTPRGTFKITEKIRTGKHSTLYKSAMPYWMRLDESAIGMHTGQLPGYAASHGCVRMPDESARFIFDLVPKGTTVQIVDSMKPKVVEPPPAMVAER